MKLLWTTLFSFILISAQAQDFKSSRADFDRMASYLANGSGKWMTPNPNHDPNNPASSKAIGLWFERRLNDNLLSLNIVSYRGDTAFVTSEAQWVWHPGEQRIKYLMMSIRGNFIDGETYFTSDKVFVTRNFTYSENGEMFFSRGENFILTDTEHETASQRFIDGKWVEQARFKWKLTKEFEGYKIVKRL